MVSVEKRVTVLQRRRCRGSCVLGGLGRKRLLLPHHVLLYYSQGKSSSWDSSGGIFPFWPKWWWLGFYLKLLLADSPRRTEGVHSTVRVPGSAGVSLWRGRCPFVKTGLALDGWFSLRGQRAWLPVSWFTTLPQGMPSSSTRVTRFKIY